MSEMLKILFDSKANAVEKVAKNGNKYLRIDFGKDFGLTPDGGKTGITCLCTFINEHNIKMVAYEYNYFKLLGGKKATNQKEYDIKSKKWAKLPWTRRYRMFPTSIVIKKNKNGSLTALRIAKPYKLSKKDKETRIAVSKDYEKIAATYLAQIISTMRQTRQSNESAGKPTKFDSYDIGMFMPNYATQVNKADRTAKEETKFLIQIATKFISDNINTLTARPSSGKRKKR
jgi:hypothetical protein